MTTLLDRALDQLQSYAANAGSDGMWNLGIAAREELARLRAQVAAGERIARAATPGPSGDIQVALELRFALAAWDAAKNEAEGA